MPVSSSLVHLGTTDPYKILQAPYRWKRYLSNCPVAADLTLITLNQLPP